jgi:hypothetical protein
MDWIAGNSLYKSSSYTRQQQQSIMHAVNIWMLSGPDALDGLMFLSSFSTPSDFIFIDGIVDFRFM